MYDARQKGNLDFIYYTETGTITVHYLITFSRRPRTDRIVV